MIDETMFIASFCEINEVEERSARHAYMMFDAVGHSERRIIYHSEVTTVHIRLIAAEERPALPVEKKLRSKLGAAH